MGSINCKHNDPDHISYSIGETVWMKCDCGETWTGDVPRWVSANLCRRDEEIDALEAQAKEDAAAMRVAKNTIHIENIQERRPALERTEEALGKRLAARKREGGENG